MGWWTWGELSGALVRRLPATVVNVSDRGCLIETAAPLDPGTIAFLELDGVAQPQSKALRVCHSIQRPGSAMPFRAGTEFVVLDLPIATSARQEAARGEATRFVSRRLPRAGADSGPNGTPRKASRNRGAGGAGEDPENRPE